MMRDAPLALKILVLALLCTTCGMGLVWLISKGSGFWLFLSLVFADMAVLGGYRLYRHNMASGGRHA